MTFPVKEAAISAEDTPFSLYWLDNTHVLFRGFTGAERGPGKEVRLLDLGFYVWDIEHDTVTKDARFEHGGPVCINGHTKSYILSYSLDGKTSKRRAFVGGQEISLSDQVWVNPISCRASTTEPPWVVKGRAIRPLLEEHGYLDRGIFGEDRRSKLPILYYRTGVTQPISLGLQSRHVEPLVTYYPFADAYLIKGEQTTPDAPPLWLLHPDGTLEQIFSPEGKAWAQIGWTQFLLTKRGLFFISRRHPGLGDIGQAGLYSVQGTKASRVLETVMSWAIVSPDGCKLAFIKDRWDPNLRADERYRLQVIDVCQGPSK